MPDDSKDKYVVKKPAYEEYPYAVANRQFPMTLMSAAQVQECNNYARLGWVTGMPEPDRHVGGHLHDYDEILLFIGGDSREPQVLGAELELYLGGQKILFNTTTCILVPKGVKHGPLTWKKYEKPHLILSVLVGSGTQEHRSIADEDARQKADNIDYEQYVVRSPIYEDAPVVANRQTPTMTYMSAHHVRGTKYYIEFGWLWGMPEPNPHIYEHKHHYDELVFHFGGDHQEPESLCGEIEIEIDGQPVTFNTTTCICLPKGIKHGPLVWRKFDKPHVEMAVMLGCGTFKEGWGANIDHLQPPEPKSI